MEPDDRIRSTPRISCESSARDASQLMQRQHTQAMLVVGTEGAIVGLVTAGSLVANVLAAGRDPAAVRAGEVMEAAPPPISEAASVDEMLAEMRRSGARRLLLLDDDGHGQGLVELEDLALLLGAVDDLVERGLLRARRAALARTARAATPALARSA